MNRSKRRMVMETVVWGSLAALWMLVVSGCGGGARRGEIGAIREAPEEIQRQGIALSLDPTEVGVIRLPTVADTLPKLDASQYVIGVDDVLEVSIYARNQPETEEPERVAVRADGKIFLSLLGEIQAAGVTVQELQDWITQQAAPFVKDPFVLLRVVEYNSQRVTIFGEIGGSAGTGGRAISVPLRGPTRIVDILAAHIITEGLQTRVATTIGSPTQEADLSNIIVSRATGERFRVNLNTYLFGLDAAANIEVRDGDVIFIPHQRDTRVFVLGEVQAPGPVPIGLGLTTAEAIARAGGFTNVARENDIKLVRGGLIDPEVITVRVRDVVRRGRRTADMPLRNGDIVYVPRSPLGDINNLLSQILPALQTFILVEAASN